MPKSTSFKALKQLASTAGRGILLQMLPSIAGGVLTRFFHEWKVDEGKILYYVENNVSLWSMLEDQQREDLRGAVAFIGRDEFITPEWVINSIKNDFTAVAGLFLSSPAAAEWLNRQVEELKAEITKTC